MSDQGDYWASNQEHQLGRPPVDVTGICGKYEKTGLLALLSLGLNDQEWNLGSNLWLETIPPDWEIEDMSVIQLLER